MIDPVAIAYENLIGYRRDLDTRSVPMWIGLKKNRELTEVHHVDEKDFDMNSDEDQDRIHQLLSIPNINESTYHYIGPGSIVINHHLWHEHLHDLPIPTHIKQHVKSIDSILIPKTEGQFKLYSGLQMSPAHLSGMEWNSTRPKKLIHVPSYLSTSTDMNIAEMFTNPDEETQHHESDHHGIILPNARHIIELNFKNGIHDAASLKKHSDSNENEVLLGRGHQFELHPRPTLITNSEYTDPVYVWKADSFSGAQKRKKID